MHMTARQIKENMIVHFNRRGVVKTADSVRSRAHNRDAPGAAFKAARPGDSENCPVAQAHMFFDMKRQGLREPLAGQNFRQECDIAGRCGEADMQIAAVPKPIGKAEAFIMRHCTRRDEPDQQKTKRKDTAPSS